MGVYLDSTNYTEIWESTGDLCLYHFGYEECSPSHHWGPGTKDYYLLHIITAGKGTFTEVSGTHHLEARSTFLIAPGSVASYTADAEDPWTYCWIALGGNDAKACIEKAGLSIENPVSILSDSALELFKSTILEMLSLEKTRDSRGLLLLSSLYRLLACLVDENKIPVQNSLHHGLPYVTKAMDFIKSNYSRKISCEEIADHVGIHRKYLTQLFNETFFFTPQEFLISYRIERAKNLLLKSELSVREISMAVGYEDPLVFSKAFKKKTGLAPSAFLKSLLVL